MHIQWFPGHMTKALRMMEEHIKLVDAVIYVLDSRAVNSSINPAFNKVIGSKPIVYVLNKADLASEGVNRAWVRYFIGQGYHAVTTDGTKQNAVKVVPGLLTDMLRERIARFADKGVNKAMRAMVLGIPNSGKSTIINSLCGAKRAATGDKAGVTKGKQWVKIGHSIELLDTPGTLCPAFENQEIARHLAYIGSINDDIVDSAELCLEFLKEMANSRPEALLERYKLATISDQPLSLYGDICRARGFLLRGGEFDYERCAKAVIDDFRKGKLGRISLEEPEV